MNKLQTIKCLTWLKPCSWFKGAMSAGGEELVALHVVVDGPPPLSTASSPLCDDDALQY